MNSKAHVAEQAARRSLSGRLAAITRKSTNFMNRFLPCARQCARLKGYTVGQASACPPEIYDLVVDRRFT